MPTDDERAKNAGNKADLYENRYLHWGRFVRENDKWSDSSLILHTVIQK